MKNKAEEHLIAGLHQYYSAQASGASCLAIADAYSAMDNYFSAFLYEKGIIPPRNHKEKLDSMFEKFQFIFDELDIKKQTLNDFYNKWLNARYSQFSLSPRQTADFLRLSDKIMATILEEIGKAYGKAKEEFEIELKTKIMGGEECKFEEELAKAHEAVQWQIETAAEKGGWSKLAGKLSNPSNFSSVQIFSDDQTTKKIIAEDKYFGQYVAGLYRSFLNLINHIEAIRVGNKEIEKNDFMNYMFSVRLSYHGKTVEEISERLKNLLEGN